MWISNQSKADTIVKALSDEYSRKIVLSTMTESKSIEEISRHEHIPISTCYRRIHELQEAGIIKPHDTIIGNDGKKYVRYMSAFRSMTLQVDLSDMIVDIVPNTDKDKSPAGKSQRSAGTADSHFFHTLRIRSSLPVLKDCDFCQSQNVWCHSYVSGDSKSLVYVCTECQFEKLRERSESAPKVLA